MSDDDKKKTYEELERSFTHKNPEPKTRPPLPKKTTDTSADKKSNTK
jgi:hypothetical protein